ncbi:unnamed protein product [Haemonchus placei]|uniref:G_PROTEIN_RECEP_F1_2 domain-containing protein n=1 Tax=Haemonchus placei TaxID=6290 RepID=A0A0N4VUI3_HAEPC|nr:unnamed protein product [Haemonchus placei]
MNSTLVRTAQTATINGVSLPLYISIIIVCIKEWKHNHMQRTFYLLILSQGFVDFVVMTNYILFWSLRVLNLFAEFYWNYQSYFIATWAFNQTYISVIIRCFGVLLITFQRYISLCRNGSRIEQVAWIFIVTTSPKPLQMKLQSQDGPIFTMRIVFPLVSCFFSYVNAWMILFFNDDIRTKIFVLIGVRKQKVKVNYVYKM